ncbi:hypothetical protein C8R45DRAFT_1182358 [Mycena sanguinolenta]|nr:hypothetical protein C8R45DRAFT_1182358 [Mycena sanguinolenta]
MSILSRAISPWMHALWQLVRALLRRRHTGDLESGTLVPVATKIQSNVSHLVLQNHLSHIFRSLVKQGTEPIPTFQPDITGVPAVVLTSMAVGAACAPDTPIAIKSAHFPGAPAIPIIVVTPPGTEEVARHEDENEFAESTSNPVDAGHSPLRSITNVPRVHGKTPRQTRVLDKAKENIRLHPNVPRLCHHPVESATPSLVATTRQGVTVALPEWERAKASQLKQAKEWSEAVKARRRSLPIPPKHALAAPSLRASLPARLSVAERLRPAATSCRHRTTDDHISYVLVDEDDYEVAAINLPDTDHQPPSSTSLGSSTLMSSASSGSISSLIEAYETDFTSSAWLSLRQFTESDGTNGSGLAAGAGTRDVGGHPGYEGRRVARSL